MKLSSILPVAALLAAVTSEPIPVKRGVLLKKDEDCETTSSFDVDPVAATGYVPGMVNRRPPPWATHAYGTGGWGGAPSPQPTGSVTSPSTDSISISDSFSDAPTNGTVSASSTEGSPVTGPEYTSTALITQTVTLNSTDSGPSVSILPITDSISPSGVFPPYGYFPVPSGAVSSSSSVDSPVAGSESSFPAFPTPCNETTAPNTAPTAPLSTGKTTITLPLTLTSTLSGTTITISPLASSPVSPVTGSDVTSSSGTSPPHSAPSASRSGNGTSSVSGTGIPVSPVSPITATDGSSGFPVGTGEPTGRPTGYWPLPYPPFPISSSGYLTMSGTGTAPNSSPVAPVTGSNSTSNIPGPTGTSSSLVVGGNVTTISTGTTYTVTIPTPPMVGPSSTEGSPVAPPSNSTYSLSPTGPSTTITSRSTRTDTTTFTVPGITTRTVAETFTVNTTLTISVGGTGRPSSSTEGSPVLVSPSASSIPLSTGGGQGTTSSRLSGPAPYPSYSSSAPSAPLSTGVSSSSSLDSPVNGSNATSSLPIGTGTGVTYPPSSPTGAVSSTSSLGDAVFGSDSSIPATATASLGFTSAFTTITITPRTSLTSSSPTATNTPYTPTSAARLPGSGSGGYGGALPPAPGYGEVYEPEAQGWTGIWGRVIGNW